MIPGGKYSGPQLWDGGRSLYLPFSVDKALDSRINFTRASSGTYFDASGVLQTATTDEPRFTHNPATGESLGLLIEGATTNLLTYSEDFANGAWIAGRGALTSNAITAPDGTLTADKFVKGNGETGAAGMYRAISQTAANHAVSVYAKAGEVTQIRLNPESPSASVTAQFDLSNGTIIGTNAGAGTIVSQSIEHVGDGWYRCSVAWTVAAGTGQWSVYGMVAGDVSWTGNGTNGFYIWGAQLEVGSKETSYIKTEASQVTRAAEFPRMTGTNFSDWFNPPEGTFLIEYNCLKDADGAGNIAFSASDGTGDNMLTLYTDEAGGAGLQTAMYVKTGGSLVAQLQFGTLTPAVDRSVAFAYAANNFAASLDGAAVITDSAGAVPVAMTRLDIGTQYAGTQQLNGTIKRLTYYPRRLPNINLQDLADGAVR